jgi:glycosyltransferase involved in cell wall biosynthesis
MRIAVNTRLLIKDKLDGIGWFAYETLKRITRDHPEHSFIFMFDRPFNQEFIFQENVEGIVVSPPARHPLLWYTWFELFLPAAIKKTGADILFSPDGYMPLNLKIPALIAIHDINFHHRPFDLPISSRFYYRRYFPCFARKADRIVTVSAFSKKDIASSYSIDVNKIDIVFNGSNEVYSPVPDELIEKTRNSLTGGAPYFVFVGSLHPRKNLSRLLLAFDHFKKTRPNPYKLVIVGEKIFMTAEIEKTYREMQHGMDVIFHDRLSPAKLHHVLGAAAGLTFVPLFEGFGIPLLEAMHCEIPILTSNVTSLPEIAGQAALYVDPMNVTAIAEGMESLAIDIDLRNRLISAGRVRKTAFSWDMTADKVWKSIEMVMPEN